MFDRRFEDRQAIEARGASKVVTQAVACVYTLISMSCLA